jgi:nitrogen regulatory protein PII
MPKRLIKKLTGKKDIVSTEPKKEISNVKRLKMLVTVVDRSKTIFYQDLLEQFEVNVQMILYGKGTANSEMLNLLGLDESDKAVILSYIKEERVKDAIETLNEKFHKVKNGKGVAFTIALDSIIGVSMYQLLSNDRTNIEGGKK